MPTVLRIQVDDQALQALQIRADDVRKDVEYVASLLLRSAIQHLPLAEAYTVVAGEQQSRLEAILGGGSLLNAQDLVTKTERLAGISFHHVRLPFSPNQLEEIERRAERLGLTPEQLIERCARTMYELFFTHLGHGVEPVADPAVV